MRRKQGTWSVRLIVSLGLACSLSSSMPAAAALPAVDPSDIWWTRDESGWGMQLVQGGDAIFATLFVYGSSSNPTFFTATLSLSAGSWAGTLYRSAGPYFATPTFDPTTVVLQPVGTMTFTPQSSDAAALQYAVDGAVVTKQVQRMLLRYDDYTGAYGITTQRVTTHCPDSTQTEALVAETLVVKQTGTLLKPAI